jgi:hypothetical protein
MSVGLSNTPQVLTAGLRRPPADWSSAVGGRQFPPTDPVICVGQPLDKPLTAVGSDNKMLAGASHFVQFYVVFHILK